MGIGPDSGLAAHNIWKFIEVTHKSTDDLLNSYKEFARREDFHLNNLVKNITLPINASSGILAQTVLKKKPFEVHENLCVDNEFNPTGETLISRHENLIKAIKQAKNYCNTYPYVEYGYTIGDSCLEEASLEESENE